MFHFYPVFSRDPCHFFSCAVWFAFFNSVFQFSFWCHHAQFFNFDVSFTFTPRPVFQCWSDFFSMMMLSPSLDVSSFSLSWVIFMCFQFGFMSRSTEFFVFVWAIWLSRPCYFCDFQKSTGQHVELSYICSFLVLSLLQAISTEPEVGHSIIKFVFHIDFTKSGGLICFSTFHVKMFCCLSWKFVLFCNVWLLHLMCF